MACGAAVSRIRVHQAGIGLLHPAGVGWPGPALPAENPPAMSTADTLPDLRLFGEPALQLGGRWFAWRREQRFRLLGYLAVEARPVDRDELACLFWPDEPAEAARRNLRKTLFRLRPWLAEVGVPWANDTASAAGCDDGASRQLLGGSDLERLRQAPVRADAVAAAGL